VTNACKTDVALDPEVAAVLETAGNMPYLDLDALPVGEALKMVRPPVATAPPPNSKDIFISAHDGADIRVRLYFPKERTAHLPVLLYAHGGGFVGGTIEQDDWRCAWLAEQAHCIVASLDYRLAPEHPFPIGIEDGFSAWTWITTEAESFGGDKNRCAISGSSAGGHIAIGATLLARARRATMPLLQQLTYPVVDPGLDTGSYRNFAEGPFMTKARMAWYWKQYASAAARLHGDLWAPLSAEAAGLPRAHVITAEYDVLRDEGEAYAAHLREAGIAATVERHPRMIHGFITIVPKHKESVAALESSAAHLRNVFN
jgi:acetyl esterase